MRLTDTKQARYSMLLICEGTHTEPNFLELMIEDFKEAGIIDFATTIKPKPTISPSDNTLDLNRGKEKRRKRLLKNTTQKQQEIENMDFFPGEQPLNWVKGGIDNLKVYDEVWVFFDKDGHPKAKEAFEMARITEIDGKKINIAFSSRCFEYYLLLHFELIYRAFEKSECNGKTYSQGGKKSKTISYYCMTDRAVKGKACNGDVCINGYARKNNYWKNSKGDLSTYTFVKEKIWTGVYNAHLIRWKSNTLHQNEYYERNPYVDVDKFVCRLMGYSTINFEESYEVTDDKINYCITREYNTITLTLLNTKTLILSQGNITAHDYNTRDYRGINIHAILTEDNPIFSINLKEIITPNEFCVISILSKKYYCPLFPLQTIIWH